MLEKRKPTFCVIKSTSSFLQNRWNLKYLPSLWNIWIVPAHLKKNQWHLKIFILRHNCVSWQSISWFKSIWISIRRHVEFHSYFLSFTSHHSNTFILMKSIYKAHGLWCKRGIFSWWRVKRFDIADQIFVMIAMHFNSQTVCLHANLLSLYGTLYLFSPVLLLHREWIEQRKTMQNCPAVFGIRRWRWWRLWRWKVKIVVIAQSIQIHLQFSPLNS